MLGRGLQGLGQAAGIIPEDPRIAEARKLQEVTTEIQQEGIDPSDPIKFYDTLSRKLADRGLTEQSLQMTVKAADLKMKQLKNSAEIGKLDAERLKALRDKESGVAQVQREITEAVGRGDVNAAMELQKKLDALILPESLESEEGAGTLTVDGKQVPAVRKLIVSKDGKQVLWRGEPFAKGGGVTVQNLPPTTDAGVDALKAGFDYQQKKFSDQLSASESLRPVIQDMANLVKDPKIITGSLPEIRNEALRALDTLGFLSPEKRQTITDNDLFDAYATQVVIPRLQQFGGNDSNEELRAVRNSYANRKMDIAAIRRLITAAQRDIDRASGIDAEYNRGLSEGRNPIGFNFATGKWRNIAGLPNMSYGGQRSTTPSTASTTPPSTTRPAPVTTYDQWRAWATANGHNPDDFNREEVEARLRQRSGQ
jgi:hypothetical protein